MQSLPKTFSAHHALPLVADLAKVMELYQHHRPADHTAREQIDDGCDVEPSLRGPDISEVRDPFAVRRRYYKPAIEHVRSDGARLSIALIGWQPTPARSCPEDLARFSRSIRCSPQTTPSASRSCQPAERHRSGRCRGSWCGPWHHFFVLAMRRLGGRVNHA